MKRFLVSLCISLLGMSNTYANDNYMVTKDITFKTVDGRVLKLDLYKPKAERIQPYPLLIWVHGGAWKRGSKDDIPTKNPLLLSSVLQQGYALAAVNYRLSGEATFPAPVQDINDAVNFLYDNALQFHIKADKVVMMGRSAGGHLAGLMGTTNTHSNLTFYAKPKYQVKAVVSFFGPTDLLALANKGGKETSKQSSVSRFLGDTPSAIPQIAKQASSTSYVNERTPPFIQLHGTVDKQVPLEQSQLLKAKLDEYGINNQLWIEQNVGHSDPIFDTEKYVPKVITFINEHLPTEPL
ncbi:alpha/beta hydrolase fold domain-containing protein [Vibrio cholerae]|uniref:alpha/beta hydrolase family protein n=1 Tax=Vibrio cholerae TaxID=666 RepID=UPI001DE86DC2|nr:alpha/beta hydrolase [Vibrio cholerae]EGR0791802.1 alpha/beta hydrolase [Vibrio cholerae]EGR0806226.1 alpha/beta hydrolase [Vibrio cholerae]EGR0809766.1 alpha/beta hydrolase [Vibrio cholerae]EGR0871892.1 alpha/beta hydrolase [Vibrio cholerae]EJE4210910.1 alpha/beta hydrolase [Vibrio cholerae]